jgi:transketolase
MRTPSAVIYGPEWTFEFGKAYLPRQAPDPAAVVVSSGRGVHEALAAATLCASRGVSVSVVDMPSIDEALLIELCRSNTLICVAEQNNGYILQNLLKVVYLRCPDVATSALERVLAINTLDAGGRPRFIHSGTYEELIAAFGLEPAQIADAVVQRLMQRGAR